MLASQLRGNLTWPRGFESYAVASLLTVSRTREKQYACKSTELSSEKKANVWEIIFYLEKEPDSRYLSLIREQLLI